MLKILHVFKQSISNSVVLLIANLYYCGYIIGIGWKSFLALYVVGWST